MTTYYKAVQPDGRDFHTGRIRYGVGAIVRHPTSRRFEDMRPNRPSTYLSTSVELGEVLLGGRWPCRPGAARPGLFRVEPIGGVVARTDGKYPYKRGCVSMFVAEELPAHLALGPNGMQVAALVERFGSLTAFEHERLGAAWDATESGPGTAAWDAAWDAAVATKRTGCMGVVATKQTAWAVWAPGGAGNAARDAAVALVVRDVLAPEYFDVLYGPWASVIGDDRG